MATDMLSIGVSGLHAAQLGMQVTQNNIANANTAGYNRQYLLQSSAIPVASGSGFFGSGASVDTVMRSYDKYLTQEVFAAQSRASAADAQVSQLSQVDNMLGDSTTGLSSALSSFFTAVQQVAANPSLISARQTMLSSSDALTNRFNTMAQRLSEVYDSVNSQITSEATSINSYASQLADVNATIAHATASSQQIPNDLLDERDQLVSELSKHIQVSAVVDSTGAYNVFIGNGQQLVIGSVANRVVPMASSADPQRVVIGLQGPSGSVQELPENLIQGGTLGGLVSFRSGSLDGEVNSLGVLAASVALTFNAQHALGQDLNGANATSAVSAGFQSNYFQINQPTVTATSATVSNPANISVSFLAPSVNASSGNFYTKLTGSDYTLQFDGTNYSMTRATDGTVWTDTSLAGLNTKIVNEGIAVDLPPSGVAPVAGVSYFIQPTSQAALNIKVNSTVDVDPRKIAVAAPVATTLGAKNTGSLSVTQGQVSTGYSLSNVAAASGATPAVPTFKYSASSQQFTVSVGANPVSVQARYTDGSSQIISIPASGSATINWSNAGATLSGIDYDATVSAGVVTAKGISVDIAGTPGNGDTFTIGANLNGQSDSRNVVKMAALQVQSTTQNGKATFQDYYASLVGKVGAQTQLAKNTSTSQATLLKQSQSARDSVSGVNLDEEAASLIKYQQAYQAAAKALDIASKMFDAILAINA